MSKVKIQGNASGTGVVTVEAPNTNTDRTVTLPDSTGTLLMTDGDGSSLTNLPAAGISNLAPYWYISENASQSVSDYTMTKMTFADGEIDSNSAYDTTNHRFTVPSGQAGKYYIWISASYITSGNNLRISQSDIRINGTSASIVLNGGPGGTNYLESADTQNIIIADLSVGDYVEAWGAVDWVANSGSFASRQFGGFKIG